MRKHPGLLFVILTYILTWSVEVPAALAKHGYISISIPKALQTICTLSPGIAALLLTGIFFKKGSVKGLLKAAIKFRVPFKWYIIMLVLSAGLCGLSLFLFGLAYGQVNPPEAVYNFIFYFLLILPLSALWEEIGWRGFLLPVLQEKYSPLTASLLIGFVWGLWHLPVYLAIDPYGANTINYFVCMFIGCFALSIIETWLYRSTRGSLLICILFHNAVNTSAVYFYGNLKGDEFRPLIIFVGLLVLTAIVIGVRTRGRFIEGGDAISANTKVALDIARNEV